MGLSQDQSLSLYGTVAYTGWGEAEAAADAASKGLSGGGGGGGDGGVPSFSFDYAGAAQKAYGDLGVYYDRLLRESQGDLNKVLSRLVEDYESGLRIRKESTAFDTQTIDQSQVEAARQNKLAQQNVINNAISRGLYTKSGMDPNGGYGIADTNLERVNAGFGYQTEQRNRRKLALQTNLKNYEDQSTTQLKRQQTDYPEKQKRYEFDLEQRRRTEAANMANQAGQRAYQDYLSKFTNLG